MNKIITILISIIFGSLSINPVKAQEKYPLPTKDSPVWLEASDGSRLTFYNYFKDDNNKNQMILLDGVLSSPNEPQKNVLLTFNCNLNDTGLLTIGTLQQETFNVESQGVFPAQALQIFRYSYCDGAGAEKIIETRPSIDFATNDCSIAMMTKEKTEVPCNYLVITVGDHAINYHYVLRDDQDKLYSVSYVVLINSPSSIFAVMMDLQGEEPFDFEAQGQCQKQKINNRTDKLTCQAISPDGSKINGEVLVPNFNIEEIIRELQ